MAEWQALINHLQQQIGGSLSNPVFRSIGGGDINQAYQLQTLEHSWFVKLNRADMQEMFAAEAAGLQELAACGKVRVPEVITYGHFQQHAYLVLEFIELTRLRASVGAVLGQQLAVQHQIVQTGFGWQRDNTIGATPQSNRWHKDWISFWRDERLGRQLMFAADNGYTGVLQSRGELLLDSLSGFFSSYQPQPALLHGDLWGGNAAADGQGQPVIFDPACYFGDRETDLAMTELFGGFSADFYSAYQEVFPLDVGYKARKNLYNLYHVLNHLNLFGRSYLSQAIDIIERLLVELA